MPTKTWTSPVHRFSGQAPEPSELERFMELCQLRPGQLRPGLRSLDLATGRGSVAYLLTVEGLKNVFGVDVCASNLTEAARIASKDNGPRFACANAANLPFADKSFELVVTRRGPHHIKDLPAALDEIQRVLVAGGRLVIEDRSVPEDPAIGRLWNELDKLHAPSHVEEYSASAWRKMLTSHGFEIEILESYERELPLDLFLDTGCEEATDAIKARLASLDSTLRAGLGLDRRSDGTRYLRHNYLRLAACKPAR